MQLSVWQNVRIELPGDWELLQFSLQAEAGRCAFADRYQMRLELNWRTVPGPPDLQRTMSDYVARLRLTESMADAASTEAAGWPGIEGHQAGLATTRFGRYLADASRLVEIVFLWPEARDRELEGRVLGSTAIEPERLGRFRRWRAFGMDLLATGGLRLAACQVLPAKARMAFGDGKGGAEESFERLGLVGEWLRGSVRDWLEHVARKEADLDGGDAVERRGHTVETVAGRRRGRGIARLWRGRSRYASAAWTCPADGRLYRVTTTGGPEAAGEELAGRRLSCCGDMELGT